MSAESDANKAIIRDFFATSNAGGDILTFLDDDATWWVPGHWRFGGSYRKDELAPVFESVFALMDGPLSMTLHAVTAEEDRVAVDGEGVGRFKDGTPYRNTYHFLFRLRGGRIVSVKEHMNTAYMSRTLDEQFARAG